MRGLLKTTKCGRFLGENNKTNTDVAFSFTTTLKSDFECLDEWLIDYKGRDQETSVTALFKMFCSLRGLTSKQ